MKVAYIFALPRTASYKLAQMILPQLEARTHGVEVVGMFFFDDNTFVLRKGDLIGQRLAKVAKEQGILLMMCDMCALERNLAEGEPYDDEHKASSAEMGDWNVTKVRRFVEDVGVALQPTANEQFLHERSHEAESDDPQTQRQPSR